MQLEAVFGGLGLEQPAESGDDDLEEVGHLYVHLLWDDLQHLGSARKLDRERGGGAERASNRDRDRKNETYHAGGQSTHTERQEGRDRQTTGLPSGTTASVFLRRHGEKQSTRHAQRYRFVKGTTSNHAPEPKNTPSPPLAMAK